MTEEEYTKLSDREKFIYRALYENGSTDDRIKVIVSMLGHLDFTGQYLFASPERIARETGINAEAVKGVYAELEAGDNPVIIKQNGGFYNVNTNKRVDAK